MSSRRHLALLAAGLLVAVHFALLALHTPPAFSSPDANGYYAQAALLAEKGTVALEPSSALSYLGMHWLETPDGDFFSRYPPGVAVLMYVPYVFAGPELAALVTPLLASLTLLFLFLLARPFLGSGYALLAAGLYGLHPLANEHALNWGAHTQAGFFLVAGLYVLTAWARSPHWAKALLAGLLLGAVPTMRYAEVVTGLGVGVYLLMRAWRESRLWRHVGLALLGALVPVGGLLLFNSSAFGAPLDTGYALTGEQQVGTGFALSYFEQKWEGFASGLMTSGLGLFFALGVAGVGGMLRLRETRAFGVLLALVIVPVTAAYTAYYWGGAGEMGLRFLLPTLPLYLIPALWVFRVGIANVANVATDANDAGSMGGDPSPVNRAVAGQGLRAGLLLLVVIQGLYWGANSVLRVGREGQNLRQVHEITRYLENELPGGGVVIADRGLHDTLQYFQRWELVDASVVTGRETMRGGRTRASAGSSGLPGAAMGAGDLRAPGGSSSAGGAPAPGASASGTAAGRGQAEITLNPDRAEPMQRGKAQKLRAKYDVRDPEQRAALVLADLDELAGGKRVLWIGREAAVRAWSRYLPDGRELVKIGELEAPLRTGPGAGPGGPGGPGGMLGGPGAGMAAGPRGGFAGGMQGPGGLRRGARGGQAGQGAQKLLVYELR